MRTAVPSHLAVTYGHSHKAFGGTSAHKANKILYSSAVRSHAYAYAHVHTNPAIYPYNLRNNLFHSLAKPNPYPYAHPHIQFLCPFPNPNFHRLAHLPTAHHRSSPRTPPYRHPPPRSSATPSSNPVDPSSASSHISASTSPSRPASLQAPHQRCDEPAAQAAT